MYNIKVPCTSANIGPGFDSLGIALSLYSEICFKESKKEYFEITGCETKYRNENNLIYTSFRYTEKFMSFQPKNINININTEIPSSRGLGSSAACVVGGITGAFKMHNKKIDRKIILDLATQIEGHPDNVSPCIYGGLTASLVDKNEILIEKYNVSKDIFFYVIIPDFELSTSSAREVIPSEILFKDAVYNLSSIPFLIKGLESGNMKYINSSIKDKLHQPYREKLIKESQKIKDIITKNSSAYYISGAGPTIVCVSDNNNLKKKLVNDLKCTDNDWTVKKLEVDEKGLRIRSKV